MVFPSSLSVSNKLFVLAFNLCLFKTSSNFSFLSSTLIFYILLLLLSNAAMGSLFAYENT